MKHREVLIIILFAISIHAISQVNNASFVHLLKFKSYERKGNIAIPFVEFCILDKDSINDCIYSDFDGFATLTIDSGNYNLDSIYIKIKFKNEQVPKDKSKTLKLLLRDIELSKEIDFNDAKIVLVKHDLMTTKEYRKYLKSLMKLPK